jgi:DDE superfamily endonuclease
VYLRPYDPNRPVVCMDETSKQLIADTRIPIAAKAGHPQRYDVEYKRCGVTNIFMFTEPLGGWRRVGVTNYRKRLDWAEQIRILLEEDYPDAEVVVLVMDNLNTHSIGSLYEAFEPAKARELARRLEIHYTPKHGSWLNIAESELSVLSRQCLNRRIESFELLESECLSWNVERNELQKGVDWQFTTTDARIKLKRLYPHVQT